METKQLEQELEQCELAITGEAAGQPYVMCRRLADCTTQLIEAKKTSPVKASLGRIAEVYCSSRNMALKIAIENVFLYSLANYIFLSGDRVKNMGLLPQTFRELLRSHMVPFGI